MKQLKCEMCGGTDLIKQDGVFVCQSCGVKYSVEEAKRMMVEISGNITIDNPIEVKGIAKSDTMLENAMNTFNQGSYAEAYRLFTDVLNMEPNNPKACFYRGLSAAYQSSVASPRYEEAANATVTAVNNALQNYDNEKLDAFIAEVLHKFAHITCAICALYDGYVSNVDSSVQVYGLTSAYVKNETMNNINIRTNQTKILQSINFHMVSNKGINLVLSKLTSYSEDFCSGYVEFIDAGFTLGGSYIYNVPEQVAATVETLEKLKKLNITEQFPNAFALERKLIQKILSRPFFGPNDAWAKVQFWANKHNISQPECGRVVTAQNAHTSNDGCYVATCVYGSYDCPQVWTLRRYRDNTLASTWYGRAFIRTYYAISPTIVKWFGNTQWFKNLWKNKLDKMVFNLRSNGVEDTPYQDKDWR